MTTVAPTTLDVAAVRVEHLMDVAVELVPPQFIPTPLGIRLNYVLKGGTCEDARVRGTILPGGGDWILRGKDNIGRIDIRATLETDDGELNYVTMLEVVETPEDAPQRLAAGERLAWNEIRMRTTPRFETGAARYTWLNSVIAIGIHDLGPNDDETFRVGHHLFQIH